MDRNIVLYIAMSLDGFIAKDDFSVDWLVGHGESDINDDGYTKFYDSIDTVIMGRKTYEQVINELSPEVWVYEGKVCYVAASKGKGFEGRATFINNDVPHFIKSLKDKPGKDIWIIGGSKLVSSLILENIIDKYVITIIPTILGSGIPLFLNDKVEIELRLDKTRTIDGMVELTYTKRYIDILR